jgi:hypothetical protein
MSTNDGTYEGGVNLGTPGLIQADPDEAADFDGASGQVSVPFSANLNAAQFSVDAWVVLKDTPGTARSVVASFDEAQHAGFALIAGASGFWEAVVGDGSGWVHLQSGVAVSEGETTYLAMVFDGSTLSLGAASPSGDLDKSEANTTVNNFQQNASSPLTIGGPGPEAAAAFKGTIDEVAVYNAALTVDQAGGHWNAGICGTTGQRPEEIIESADPITVTTATLRGSINPYGVASTYHFEYGKTNSYGLTAPSTDADAGSGSTYQEVSPQLVTGLEPHTRYHYRLKATYGNNLTSNSADEVFTTNPSTAYHDDVVATSGLLAYWRLDEGSGSVAAALGPGGASAGQFAGTYTGNPTLGVTPGALDPSGDPDSAVSFNGSQYVFVPLPAAQWVGANFSLEFWFKTTTPGPGTGQWYLGAGLLDGDVAGSQNDFGTSISSGGHVLAGTGNPNTTIQSPGSYIDGGWHYVVFTRTQGSGTLTLYLDGAQVSTQSGASTALLNAPKTLAIAKVQTGANFQGSIDEVAIYSNVLTPAQIQNRYTLATTVTQQ